MMAFEACPADTRAMPTTALPASPDAMRDLAIRIARAWLPLTVFSALALLYFVVDFIRGNNAAPVVLAAIGSLAVVTPIGALACRRIEARHMRAAGAVALSLACAALWGTLMLLYFSGGDTSNPDRMRILRAAGSGAMLYLPTLWLACGGLRLHEPTGAAARLGPRLRIAIATLEAVLWIVAGYALIRLWDGWAHALDFWSNWGPLSYLLFEAAVLMCALCAVRAVRRGPWYVLVPIALIALRLAWFQWWMLKFDMLAIFMGH
jgi:hypothetical protein